MLGDFGQNIRRKHWKARSVRAWNSLPSDVVCHCKLRSMWVENVSPINSPALAEGVLQTAWPAFSICEWLVFPALAGDLLLLKQHQNIPTPLLYKAQTQFPRG